MSNISYQNYGLKDLVIKAGERILPNTEYNLKSFSINFEANNHTKVDIEMELYSDELNSYIQFNRTVDPEFIIAMNTLFESKKEELIFSTGHVLNSTFYNSGKNRYFLKIEATSLSEKMDRVKKYRAFQKITLTYEEVVKQIFDDYPNIPYLLNSDRLKETIKAPLIQFKETDWEFLVRVLSRIGLCAFSLANGSISLGFINTEVRKKKYDGNYGKVGYVRERNQSIGYLIESEQSYSLGDVVEIVAPDLKVDGNVVLGKIEYIYGKFVGQYLLQQKSYIYPYIPNKNITGCVLEANVEKVFERDGIAVMEVNLSKGLAKYTSVKSRTNENLKEYPDNKNGRFIFPYTTPYSQSNTGYFCTPETNDVVAVYFPMDEEEYGYVLWAVNNPGNGRFSNPNIRNYTIPIETKDPAYFDFRLNYDKFNIFAEKLIDMKTKEELNLKSENIMTMRSKNEYVMAVEENMQISSTKLQTTSDTHLEVIQDKKTSRIDTYEIASSKISEKSNEIIVKTNTYIKNASQIIDKS